MSSHLLAIRTLNKLPGIESQMHLIQLRLPYCPALGLDYLWRCPDLLYNDACSEEVDVDFAHAMGLVIHARTDKSTPFFFHAVVFTKKDTCCNVKQFLLLQINPTMSPSK
jgi:hypothetical protein